MVCLDGNADGDVCLTLVDASGGQALELAESEMQVGEVDQARGLFLPTATVDARYSETHGVMNVGDLVNPAYAALNQLTGSNAFPTNIDARLPSEFQ